jgi:circadian clock protein KaiB
MNPDGPMGDTEAFERALGEAEAQDRYVLRLFVSGMTPRSAQALAVVKSICEERLAGRYELEVVDIYQRPDLATDDQIIAVPTLVKMLPEPLRRYIGDLSDKERMLVGLGLERRARDDEHAG